MSTKRLSNIASCASSLLIIDNLLSYYFESNILNNLFSPCSSTLKLIHFMFGIVNIIAFSSYYIQIELILSNGLDPAHLKISKWHRHFPMDNESFIKSWSDRLSYRFSVFWFGSSDHFIRFVNLFGIFNGVIICSQFNALLPCLCYFLNFSFYLSLIQISGDFLGLQSDSNLVETNFVMFICSAFNLRYPALCILILRWLAFRTMIACGLCKWNGSKMWKQMTAMIHHYYTQPLPNPISFHIHYSPTYMHKLSVFSTFLIEGPLGFMIFGPAWSRYFAFVGFQGINLMINTTGNYGFFGALIMSEYISFLDDAVLPFSFAAAADYDKQMSIHWRWYEWVTIPIAVYILCLYVMASYIPLCGTSKRYELPFQSSGLEQLYAHFHKYRLVNYYAKFGSMHEGRYEFVLQGSDDGVEWKDYEFLFKPSKATQIPAVVPLHIPRLDWRTWFLPLYWRRYQAFGYGHYEPPKWWRNLENKLKKNEEEILKLIKFNPFPIEGPKYIRTYVHKFEFTEWNNRYDDDGNRVWWITTPQSALNE